MRVAVNIMSYSRGRGRGRGGYGSFGSGLCRKWQMDGTCVFGDVCKFEHTGGGRESPVGVADMKVTLAAMQKKLDALEKVKGDGETRSRVQARDDTAAGKRTSDNVDFEWGCTTEEDKEKEEANRKWKREWEAIEAVSDGKREPVLTEAEKEGVMKMEAFRKAQADKQVYATHRDPEVNEALQGWGDFGDEECDVSGGSDDVYSGIGVQSVEAKGVKRGSTGNPVDEPNAKRAVAKSPKKDEAKVRETGVLKTPVTDGGKSKMKIKGMATPILMDQYDVSDVTMDTVAEVVESMEAEAKRDPTGKFPELMASIRAMRIAQDELLRVTEERDILLHRERILNVMHAHLATQSATLLGSLHREERNKAHALSIKATYVMMLKESVAEALLTNSYAIKAHTEEFQGFKKEVRCCICVRC